MVLYSVELGLVAMDGWRSCPWRGNSRGRARRQSPVGHTYFLWFDEQLTPHLRPSKPPTAAELRQAKWGIGGQGVGLWDGKVRPGNSRTPDSRTAVAVDRQRKLLFLAVGQNISPRLMLEELADLGAKEGMLLDGGGSSSMAIGKGAAGVSAGVLYGGWRPVATFFGVRAQPIRDLGATSVWIRAQPGRHQGVLEHE